MKNIISNYKLIPVFVSILIFSGCTENVDINTYSSGITTLLVVDGEITTDTMAHHVTLTKSSNVTNNLPIQVFSNAIVTITDGTHIFNLKESPQKPGTYLTDSTVYGIPGITYTLNISNVDLLGNGVMESFTASSILKKINPIDSIHLQFLNSTLWTIDLYSQDIGGGLDYYLPKAYINNILKTDSIHKYSPGDNSAFNGKYYDGFPVIRLNEKITENILNPGDKVTLELDGITVDYFNFINAFIAQYNPKIPLFSGPSANIPTNIYPQNKAAGFFAVYSVQRKSHIYK
jgi:hypothetical protein